MSENNKSTEQRILKDIVLFEENISKVKKVERVDLKLDVIVDLATRYYNDAKYYLDKRDYLTSFGCINYAHGLLDAILKGGILR